MSLLALPIFIVFVTILAVAYPKTRSLAAFAILGGLIGFCLGMVVALGLAIDHAMFGFFNIGLPSVTILGVAAFGPTIWLPLVSVVPGVIGGIILWLWKRRATRGRAFPVLPVSQSQNDRP